MSNPKNNKLPQRTCLKIKEKFDFKIKKPLFCIKNESPQRTCLHLKITSSLKELDPKSKKNLILKSENLSSVSKSIHHKNMSNLEIISSLEEFVTKSKRKLISNQKTFGVYQRLATQSDHADLYPQ